MEETVEIVKRTENGNWSKW